MRISDWSSDVCSSDLTNPRNVGEIKEASGVGEVGNAKCGDIMRIYLQVEDNIIKDVKFKTFGCSAAIATSSMVTELVKGKNLEEARQISNQARSEARRVGKEGVSKCRSRWAAE